MKTPLTLSVNGDTHEIVDTRHSLLDVLRNELGPI